MELAGDHRRASRRIVIPSENNKRPAEAAPGTRRRKLGPASSESVHNNHPGSRSCLQGGRERERERAAGLVSLYASLRTVIFFHTGEGFCNFKLQ